MPAKLAVRIAALYGDAYRDKILPIQEEVDVLKVWGYISKPELAKKTRGEQYFFVNNRFIKNGYLHHAVMTAFEGLLPAASFPFYTIFLELDPEKIDINVHPTKTEIKFENERLVYSVVQAAVRKALQQTLLVPELDFEPTSPWLMQAPVSTTRTEIRSGFTGTSHYQPPQETPFQKSNRENWQKLYTTEPKTQDALLQQFERSASAENQITQTDALATKMPELVKQGHFNLHGRFLLAQVKSGMMLIHLQRAWERILYERFISQVEGKTGVSQQLLFPQTISLSSLDMALVEEMDSEIRALGIDWEPFGGNSILLRGLPAEMENQNPLLIFESFLEQFKWNQNHLQIPKNQSVARALAKRNAQQQSFHFWKDVELNDVVNQLFGCQVPHYTPDQLPITKVFNLEEMEGWL